MWKSECLLYIYRGMNYFQYPKFAFNCKLLFLMLQWQNQVGYNNEIFRVFKLLEKDPKWKNLLA